LGLSVGVDLICRSALGLVAEMTPSDPRVGLNARHLPGDRVSELGELPHRRLDVVALTTRRNGNCGHAK
jgi:hypothetical protein